MNSIWTHFLSKNKQSKAVVLMYHRIYSSIVDPWQLYVSPSNFESQLEMLTAQYHVITIAELVERLQKKTLKHGSIAISFDDGYADNFLYALPMLAKYQLPATFFVPSGFTGLKQAFWWDLLTHVFLEQALLPAQLTLELPTGIVELPISATVLTEKMAKEITAWRWPEPAPNQRCEVYLRLWELLRPLNGEEIAMAMTQIKVWGDNPLQLDDAELPMDQHQLQQLQKSPLFSVGLHSYQHLNLVSLDAPDTRADLLQNMKDLNKSGSVLPVIAYPYGQVDVHTIAAAKSVGLQAGFTTQGYPIGYHSDRFMLGRSHVKNIDGAALKHHIDYVLKMKPA